MEDGNVSDAPLPPPPPPQDELKRKRPQPKPRRQKDFREILTLFHDDAPDAARVWATLWQTTLAEAQEEHKRRRQQERQGPKLKRKGEHGLTPARLGSMRPTDPLKRARQGSTASTDSSESGKRSLGGRLPRNVPKGKLLQKLGTRGT